MVNTNKLKGKIVERGLSITSLAEEMGINRATMYRKLANGGENISVHEANVMARYLKLSQQEAMDIFFGEIVA